MSGLRQQMNEEVERRRKQREDLKAIRADLSEIEQRVTGLKTVAERLDRGDLTETIEEVMEAVESVGSTASRVARTFQARQEDLETIRQTGEEASRLEDAMRDVRWTIRKESILRHAAAILVSLVLTGTLLWSGGIVTLSLPPWMRMSEREIEAIEDARALSRATRAMTEEERAAYRELMRAGMSRADSLEAAK
jgi:DNA repair exonuclease SbcCD ATPase subunit